MDPLRAEGGWVGWRDGEGKPVFVHEGEALAMGLSVAMGKGILADVRRARGQTYVAMAEKIGLPANTCWQLTKEKGRALSGRVAEAVAGYLLEEPQGD